MPRILGLSAFYHDSAAALLENGRIVAAAQEERFTRQRHDATFPANAIRYCLQAAGRSLADVDFVVFYDKPLLKFERLLETYLAVAPRGFRAFATAMPVWLKEKLYLKQQLRRELAALGDMPQKDLPPLLFSEHHEAHAASAFYASPFTQAAVLCLDGVGEWATSSAWRGEGAQLQPLWQINFPHSLGLLYSAFTYYLGFKVNSGEYKVMGLAPYGEPRYAEQILAQLLHLCEDGSFRLDMRYFDFASGLRMTSERFHAAFGGPPRAPESPLEPRHMDLARSLQAVTETIVLRLAHTLHGQTGSRALCLAGGVALNCVANGRLLREGPFDEVWVQPAAGDAGGALGAALAAWHGHLEQPREDPAGRDSMAGAYLGPAYPAAEAAQRLAAAGARFETLEDATLYGAVAERLAAGQVVGWFQGRMEFGPRALGGRSILGDPRNPAMQSQMNLKIKYRESFRPFAPAVLAERVGDYFEHPGASPYMLFTAAVQPALRHRVPQGAQGLERLALPHSQIPAVTHVDFSARLQTVHRETNPRFHALISAFEALTGCAVLVNTSFNVRGEPIVNTPEEAYRCFMRTEMDCLVVENCLLDKGEQPPLDEDAGDWRQQFALD